MADEFGLLPQELDYLREEPIQKEILDVWEEVVQVSQREVDAKNVTVNIPSCDQYTSLHDTYFVVTCKVTKPNSEACDHAHTTAPDRVCIINNFAQSLWKNVKIEVNGKSVEDTNDLHPYRAYLEALFNHNTKVLEKRGSLIGWAKDTQNKLDIKTKGGGNAGMDTRTRPFMNSSEVTMVSKLSCDMMEEKMYLPPNWLVSIRLERSPNGFLLMAGTETVAYEVHVTDLKFFVKRVKVRDELVVAHKKLLASLPDNILRYPARRIEMKKFVISQGVLSAKLEISENCAMPDRVLVGFISKNSNHGKYTENPFNFMHKDVCKIQLEAGTEKIPREAYEPDFSKTNGYIREFYEMLASVGAHEGNTTITLTQDDFGHGFTVFPFLLVPRREHGALLGAQRTGKVVLNLSFKSASEDSFEAVVLTDTRAHFVFEKVLITPK